MSEPLVLQTATVLFTDMVGSTVFRARLGDDVADAVFAEHDQLLSEAIQLRGGHVVKRMGDGVLATFRSAAQALDAAAVIQRRVAQHNARSAAHAYQLRIGLSAGDVVLDVADVSGTPVVEASRLCEAADGGQVLLSDVVRALVGTRTPCPTQPLGALTLHGLPEPIAVHSLDWPTAADGRGPNIPSPLLQVMTNRYVGRRDLVEGLHAQLARARSGESGSALLSGEPGIGKTRTCAEVARLAADAGMVVLYGRCDEGLGAPYQPFVEALERYVRTEDRPALGRLGRELARLLPELPELLPGTGTPLASDPRTEEFRLHEAVAAWLAEASAAGGLLLVLDDLHWADPATLALLVHVLRTLAHVPSRVLVVGAFRETELEVDVRLGALLADSRRLPAASRATLIGLDESDVVELLTSEAGHALDDKQLALISRVCAECDGNPFFVRELRRHLVETGSMAQVDGRWQLTGDIDVPESLREVMARRLDVLAAGTVDVLRAASVLGREFRLEVLADVLGLPAGLVVDALEEASSARLVEETGAGSYRFAHALVRTTLYDGQSATRRAMAHRRVVDVQRATGDVALLARHALLAEPRGDQVREAAQWALAAGERALASRALADAEQWLIAALERLETLPGEGVLVARALVALGEAQRDQGNPAFRQTLEKAGALADRLGQVDLVVRAALSDDRGTTLVAAPDPARVERLERALRLVGPAPSEQRALLLVRLVGEVTFGGNQDRRRQLVLDAESMTVHFNDLHAVARVMVRGGMASHMLSGWQASLERAERNVRLADEVGDPALRVTALSWLSASQIVAGRLGQAEETSALMEAVAREASPTMRWFARLLQVKFLSLRGQFDAASAENDACLEQALELREPDAEALWGALAAAIALNAGAAAEFADAAGAFADRFPTVPGWQAGHAALLAEAGRVEEAREALARYDLDPAVLMEEPFAFQVPWSLAAAATYAGEDQLARKIQRLLGPHRGCWSHIYLGVLGPVRWALGRCATVTGSLDLAVGELTQALAETRAAGSDALTGLISLDLASAYAARAGKSDRSAAIDLLDEVRESQGRHLGPRAELLRERLTV